MYTLRKALQSHIKFVKDNIRPEELEALGLTKKQYRQAINESIKQSDGMVAFIKDGKAHAISGHLRDAENDRTYVWAITTNLTDGSAEDVIEAGQKYIDSFKGHDLFAVIDPRNKRVVKLCESIGFTPYIKLNERRQYFRKE